MKLLMHTCCAPCSVYCIDSLRKEGIEPTLYWYNPNIHPYTEYKARRDTLKEYSKLINVNAIFEEEYGLEEFCKNVINKLDSRCKDYCYRVRLEQTAKYAKENGYDAITTTLFVSPYQNHEGLKEVCEEVAKKYDLEFVYRDFRVGFREGQAKARELGLYMQKYCGCIFSEYFSNHNHSISEQKSQIIENKKIEKKIRLGRDVPNLELKPYKNGNQNELQYIYNLKKEIYKECISKKNREWNEEIQKKIFSKFMKENAKNIELIYIKDKLVGFYNGKKISEDIYEIDNICIELDYQNKGIEIAILNEVLFENKGRNVKLQVLKMNEHVIKLYEKIGFKKIDETITHYIMIKI